MNKGLWIVEQPISVIEPYTNRLEPLRLTVPYISGGLDDGEIISGCNGVFSQIHKRHVISLELC